MDTGGRREIQVAHTFFAGAVRIHIKRFPERYSFIAIQDIVEASISDIAYNPVEKQGAHYHHSITVDIQGALHFL